MALSEGQPSRGTPRPEVKGGQFVAHFASIVADGQHVPEAELSTSVVSPALKKKKREKNNRKKNGKKT